jgi:regulator of sigma E protease
MNIGNILIAFLMFSFVVIFHEFGHFIVARLNGIEVLEFSLGMGPRLFSFKAFKTRFSVKLLPLGGSCAMKGEIEKSDDPKAFTNKKVWQRMLVVLAGPFFNFILAFLLAIVMIIMGGYAKPTVTEVSENGPAAAAGLMPGDEIVKFDGQKIHFGKDLLVYFTYDEITSNKPIEVVYKREGQKFSTTVVPVENTRYLLGFTYSADAQACIISQVSENYPLAKAGIVAGDVITEINGTAVSTGEALQNYLIQNPLSGEAVTIKYTHNSLDYEVTAVPEPSTSWTVGFDYNLYEYTKATAANIIPNSAYEVKYWISSTLKGLVQIVKGKVTRDAVGGPVRIVSEISNVVDESSKYGIETVILNLLQWTVLLSANLGVMNLLPIPALDGGRFLFLIIEAIRRKPFDREKEEMVDGVFFLLLMVLMVFLFYNDFANILSNR